MTASMGAARIRWGCHSAKHPLSHKGWRERRGAPWACWGRLGQAVPFILVYSQRKPGRIFGPAGEPGCLLLVALLLRISSTLPWS
jgi:hypothetical protein